MSQMFQGGSELKKILLIICTVILLSGCTIKENKLTIIEKPDKNINKTGSLDKWQFELTSQKNMIDKNKELLQKVDNNYLPLIVSPDYSTVFAMKNLNDLKYNEKNSKVIIGNMIQMIELFVLKPSTGLKKSLGKFPAIKNYQFDENGKQLAFIDGEDNVYIYNLENDTLQNVLTKYKYRNFNSISWSKDSKRLMFDSRMIFDIASKEFISIAVDSYTPFIKKQYNDETYIVEMKNNKYDNIVALYNFEEKSYTQIADGIYMDSDNLNILYTLDNSQGLQIVNLKTFESKEIENGPIYNANILKSTGEIIYTTINPHFEDDDRYLLVIINHETMKKKVQRMCTPTYYLSPTEEMVYFISNYGENEISYDLLNSCIHGSITSKDDADLSNIKSTVLRMFQLDYNFTGSYEEYEKEAKKIYANTEYPLPQEALSNKIIDYKRFNTPLPGNQKESYMPPTLILDSIMIKNNYASINIGRFFINSIELIKIENDWFIVGFSTHPESHEVKEVREMVQNHINAIIKGDSKNALSHWNDKEDDEFSSNNRKTVQNLMNIKDKISIEIGEVELWSMSDPHRAESPGSASEARVKIFVKQGDSISKYKITLSRRYQDNFSIVSWDIDPLSISQLF